MVKRVKESTEESKSDKFKRLAQLRISRLLTGLRILGNCSGNGYEYTPEQVEEMFEALDKALAAAREKFEP